MIMSINQHLHFIESIVLKYVCVVVKWNYQLNHKWLYHCISWYKFDIEAYIFYTTEWSDQQINCKSSQESQFQIMFKSNKVTKTNINKAISWTISILQYHTYFYRKFKHTGSFTKKSKVHIAKKRKFHSSPKQGTRQKRNEKKERYSQKLGTVNTHKKNQPSSASQ